MNQIQADIEKGKAIIRKEGINFTVFKKRVSDIMTGNFKQSEDQWIKDYESYAGVRAHFNETVEDWATDNIFRIDP